MGLDDAQLQAFYAQRDERLREKRSLRAAQEAAARRRARRVGAVGFALAAALPVVLWADVVSAIASEFRIEWRYLVTGWTPWFLMGVGLLCFVRVAWLELRLDRSRFHLPGSGAWMGWGVTLYLLGFALATQVAQIANGLGSA